MPTTEFGWHQGMQHNKTTSYSLVFGASAGEVKSNYLLYFHDEMLLILQTVK